METMDLFGLHEQTEDDTASSAVTFTPVLETPERRAMRRIRSVLMSGHPVGLGYSSGKDSSVLALLVLNVAREMVEHGHECPPLVVLHSNTLVEQPEIVDLAHAEMQKMQSYAKRHGFSLIVKINYPKLSDCWQVRVIGGRALPPFPDSRADCSVDFKVLPNQRGLKEVINVLTRAKRWKPPVVMTGVRLDESIARNTRIAKRGEVAEEIWTNEDGHLRLSPILDFTLDDVWELIGLASSGVIASYSRFEETMHIYRASGGSSCVIVADMKGSNKPCGARTGCWACTRIRVDRSMDEMIASDQERYGRLKPLAALRNYISNTQYDWSLRQFVGRTINEAGEIEIGADTYSPEMLKNLLRWALSAQVKSGITIITLQQLVAIDLRWSLYALCPPFSALKIYFEVMDQGLLAEPPEVESVPKTPVPKIGRLRVGAPSYGAALPNQVTGLRNVAMEMFAETCGDTLKVLPNGSVVIDVETDDGMEVDEEGAADFVFFEGTEKVREYCTKDCSDWTWGYKTYLQYGVLSIAKGRSNQVNAILERSQWRQANGLHGQQTLQSLTERCTSLYAAQLSLID